MATQTNGLQKHALCSRENGIVHLPEINGLPPWQQSVVEARLPTQPHDPSQPELYPVGLFPAKFTSTSIRFLFSTYLRDPKYAAFRVQSSFDCR